MDILELQRNFSVEDGLFLLKILTPGLEYKYGLTNSPTLDQRAGSGFAYRNGISEEGFGILIKAPLIPSENIVGYIPGKFFGAQFKDAIVTNIQ